ncbi:MAG TPA: acetyltransferase [Thermoleophilaceae bacterium]|nr:acetyltransferase [Thermoleophilaceae bacterium]
MPDRLLICGTRSFAAEVADLVSDIPAFELAGFVENLDRARCDEPFEGLPVHWVDDIAPLADTHLAVCALATTHRSRFTSRVEALGIRAATVLHPTARIAATATLAPGTIASAGVIVGAHTRVGAHVLLNRGVLVGHHTEIGAHASVMPGANVAGNCRVADAAFIGMGAIVLDNLSVGAHSVVAAGSVVTRDVPPNVQVLGAPARVVKEGIEGR